MRILLLSTSMGMGGADKLLLTAAQTLRDSGHQVLIVSLTPLGPMGFEGRSLGLAVESLEMRRGVPDPRGLMRLVRLVRQWKPDVLHSHMVHANLMARVLRLLIPIPVVVSTIHNIYEGGRLLMTGYKLTNNLVDHMTIVSTAAADRFVTEGIVPRRLLRVVPNGVDIEQFQQVSDGTRDALRRSLGLVDDFLWLAVGRFEIAKDYPNMLRAFAQVREAERRAVLLLVGRGTLQAEAERLVAEFGLGESVRFLGVRQDVPELMRAADAFVMSSAWEGMPMVLLEASAAGLPIVATKVGGNHEVVLDEETGFLVPPRDSDALARAMLRMMRLPPADRRSMGERGYDNVRVHHRLSRVAEDWEALYREILAQKGLPLTPELTV